MKTLLRKTYEKARRLPLAAQLQECVDQLGHPEVLVSEFVDAYCEVEAHLSRGARPDPLPDAPAEEDEAELVLEYFYGGREIQVDGPELESFTCLASDFQPLWGMKPGGDDRDGLDYVGLTNASSPVPVLGAVQSAGDTSALLVLMRLLACTAELAPKPQCEWLDLDVFGGALGSELVFDLHLVLWEQSEAAEPHPIHELTRDLAEVVKQAALEDPQFPPVLGGIQAMRMDPDAFEGRLRLDWRV